MTTFKNIDEFLTDSRRIYYDKGMDKLDIRFTKEKISLNKKNSLKAELQNAFYIPLSKEEIMSTLEDTHELFQWKTNHIQIDIWDIPTNKDNKKGIPNDIWSVLVPKIIRRMETLRKLYEYTNESHILCTCIPFDVPRKLPNSMDVCVSSENINGGYTYTHMTTGNNLREIYILRKEELPKVLLHEYLHQLQVQNTSQEASSKSIWTNSILESLYTRWNISKEGCSIGMSQCKTVLEPNEAIIEFWAWIHQMNFVSIENGISREIIWNAEYQFTIQQIRKLINHQRNCSKSDQLLWHEKTHAFSYYVLKGYFAWCIHEQKDPISIDLQYSSKELFNHIQLHWEEYMRMLLSDNTLMLHKNKDISIRMTLFGDF